MRSGRARTVALLQGATSFQGNLPQELLNAIHQALGNHGLHLMVDKLPSLDSLSNGAVPKVLAEWMADGILVNHSNERRPEVQKLLGRTGCPVVWINWDLAYDCVRPDDEAAARELTARLIALGHRRIAYAECGGTRFERVPSHHFAAARFCGYKKAMASAGLTPEPLNRGKGIAPQARVAFFGAWMAEGGLPTAVVTVSTDTAVPLMFAAAAAGLRIGSDLSVGSIDSRAYSLGPAPLAFMRVPLAAMGRAAVEMLLEKLRRPRHRLPARVLPFEWVPGGTVGPPADGSARNGRDLGARQDARRHRQRTERKDSRA